MNPGAEESARKFRLDRNRNATDLPDFFGPIFTGDSRSLREPAFRATGHDLSPALAISIEPRPFSSMHATLTEAASTATHADPGRASASLHTAHAETRVQAAPCYIFATDHLPPSVCSLEPVNSNGLTPPREEPR